MAVLHQPVESQNYKKGRKLYFSGNYDEAVETLKGRRQTLESLQILSLAYEEAGSLEMAEKAITAIPSWRTYLPLLNRVGEIELARANYSEAKSIFEEALSVDSTYFESRINLAEFYHEWGRKKQAQRLAQYFVDLFRKTPYPDARLSYVAARACILLNRFEDANNLFQDAHKLRPADWRILVAWGNLFRDKYNFKEAEATYQDALKGNPNCVTAQIGLITVGQQTGDHQTQKIFDDLIKKHKNRLDVIMQAARWYLMSGDKKKAEEFVKLALKKTKNNYKAVALSGHLALLQKDMNAFKRSAARTLAINSGYGRFYTEAGHLLARRYWFREAIEMYEKAIAIDPDDAVALSGLGTTRSRLAEMASAKPALEKSFKLDPYNVWTGNLLSLFDSYKDYALLKTEHFKIRLHKDDAQIVGPYATELAEKAYEALVPKYGFKFDSLITIEIFPKHDDFAVRCFGLPGSEAFLGICFGPLITMNSPRARPVGAFSWAETLWHEFAHVVHLVLANNRVPRWLAEGISVYETTLANSAWKMNFELSMIQTLEDDKLIPLDDLDKGFVGDARRVTFSYYQASKMVEFIVNQYKFDALLKLLDRFGNGDDTQKAIKDVLSISTREFDSAFKDYLTETQSYPNTTFIRKRENLPKKEAQRIAELNRLIEEDEDDYYAHLYLGYLHLKNEKYNASIASFNRAIKLFPVHTTDDGPLPGLSRAYLAVKDTTRALQTLQMLVKHDGKNYAAALRFFKLAQAAGETESAQLALETAISISPFDSKVHRDLGKIYMLKNEKERAVREFRIELALNPIDKAGAHCRLAEALLGINDNRAARRHALMALEIAPTFERAQEILLQVAQ